MKVKPSIIAVILLIIAAIFFISTKNTQQESTTKTNSKAQSSEAFRPGRHSAKTHRANRNTASSSLAKMTNEEKVDLALGDDSISVDRAAQILLQVVTNENASVEERNDALEHALNLIDDKDFEPVLDILDPTKKELPETLVQTILDDTLNRDATVQLEASILALQGSYDATITDAKELLEFHLDQELGDDVQGWKKAIEAYKQEQAKKEMENNASASEVPSE